MSDKFKPMLAVAFGDDMTKLRYPLLASPKIDGIRCVVLGGKALTRSLKPIPNLALRRKLEVAELEGLDGELVLDGGVFQTTTSAVMGRSVPGEMTEQVTFNVFDHAGLPDGNDFAIRYSVAADFVRRANMPWVRTVPHALIGTPAELETYEAECIDQGFEGAMLRDPAGPYKHGRSTRKEGWLLKVKRFTDFEATIIGWVERMHNGNEATTNELGRTKRSSAKAGKTGLGTLGAFELTSPLFKCHVCKGTGHAQFEGGVCDDCRGTGFEIFTCGTGMDDADRAVFWHQREAMIGKLAKLKYQGHGTKHAPRSPVWIGLRDPRDMS